MLASLTPILERLGHALLQILGEGPVLNSRSEFHSESVLPWAWGPRIFVALVAPDDGGGKELLKGFERAEGSDAGVNLTNLEDRVKSMNLRGWEGLADGTQKPCRVLVRVCVANHRICLPPP